jgi:drug/metabolite transporter (DMT)-like permease
MDSILGIIMVALSGIAFGAQPIFARLAYSNGVQPITLMFLRFLFSGVFLLLLVLYREKTHLELHQVVGLLLLGGVGYVGASLSYFTALSLIPASMAVLLLYTSTIIVSVSSIWLGMDKFDTFKAVALVLSVIGIGLITTHDMGANLTGIGLGILSAIIYSGYILFGYRLLTRIEPLTATAIIMTSAAAVYMLLVIVTGFHGPTSIIGWSGVIGVSLISTVLSSLLFFSGMKLIGPASTATISTVEPVTSVVLAVIILGETLTILKTVGGLLIVAAGLILSLRAVSLQKRPDTHASSQNNSENLTI